MDGQALIPNASKNKLSMAFMVLSDAIWSRSQKELDAACSLLRNWYVNYEISPIDIAHTLGLIYLTMFPDYGPNNTPFEKDEVKATMEKAMEKITKGVPIKGERARFVFKASEPLSWMSDITDRWGLSRSTTTMPYIKKFVRHMMSANDITIDLVVEMIRRSKDATTVIDRQVASINGGLGGYLFEERSDETYQVIVDDPEPFIEVFYNYVYPIYSRVIVNRDLDVRKVNLDYYYSSFKLFYALAKVLSEQELSSEAKARASDAWLLFPHIWEHSLSDPWRKDMVLANQKMNMLLDGITHKLSYDKLFGNVEGEFFDQYVASIAKEYMNALYDMICDFCTNTSRVNTRIERSNSFLNRILGLLAGNAILFPERTGNTIAKIASDIYKKRLVNYGVSQPTQKKRLIALIHQLTEVIPPTYSIMIDRWLGKEKSLDKVINAVVSMSITTIA